MKTFSQFVAIESAPPGWDRRVEKLKPKMKSRYGEKKGEKVAFAVAWKQYNKEHGVKAEGVIGDIAGKIKDATVTRAARALPRGVKRKVFGPVHAAAASIRSRDETRTPAQRLGYKKAASRFARGTGPAPTYPTSRRGREGLRESDDPVARHVAALKAVGTDEAKFREAHAAIKADKGLEHHHLEKVAHGYIGGRTKFKTRKEAHEHIEREFVANRYNESKMKEVNKSRPW